MKDKRLVVITPVYKKKLSENEYLSIKSSLQNLKNYDKVIIAPEKFLDDQEFIDTWENYGYRVVFFKDNYFINVDSYNNLMLTKMFYSHFTDYEYMLILQLDVLIFSNSLDYWMNKNLDYVGAPWIKNDLNGIRFNFSGNGGLSLRKIKTFISVLESNQLIRKEDYYDVLPISGNLKIILLLSLLFKLKFKYNATVFRFFYKKQEDFFWAFYAHFFVKEFKVANIEDSLAFAFERYPEYCFEQNNHCLPFGVHAWEKYNPSFWEKYKKNVFNNSKNEENFYYKISSSKERSITDLVPRMV